MKTQVAPSLVCLGRAQRWSCGLNMKPIRVVPIFESFIHIWRAGFETTRTGRRYIDEDTVRAKAIVSRT